jgi:hypothetical protein
MTENSRIVAAIKGQLSKFARIILKGLPKPKQGLMREIIYGIHGKQGYQAFLCDPLPERAYTSDQDRRPPVKKPRRPGLHKVDQRADMPPASELDIVPGRGKRVRETAHNALDQLSGEHANEREYGALSSSILPAGNVTSASGSAITWKTSGCAATSALGTSWFAYVESPILLPRT